MEDVKVFWKSLTIWFNSIVATLPVVLQELQDQLPAMKGYLPDNLYSWMFVGVVVGNVLLRFKTSTGVKLK